MKLPYQMIDAFTDTPYQGNPAAVCVLDQPLSGQAMQTIAREMNLSETAFVGAADSTGVRGLRWFTPTTEVPLCGHATLATSHALRTLGHAPPFHFSSASGPLFVHGEANGALRLDFPADECRVVETDPRVLAALGLDEAVACLAGSLGYIVRVERADIVDTVTPNFTELGSIDLGDNVIVLSVTAPGERGSENPEVDVVSRVFAVWAGVDEDPVTGVAHTGLGPYWTGELGRPEFTARQGGDRRGHLRVRVEGERVHLIGHAVTVAEGTLEAPREPA